MRSILLGYSILTLIQPSVIFGFSSVKPFSLSRPFFGNVRSTNSMLQSMNTEMTELGQVPRSLALDRVICIVDDSEWRLVLIENLSSSPLVGTMALQALEAPKTESNASDIVLKCHVNQDSKSISVTSKTSPENDNSRFISTLARILVQSTIETIIEESQGNADMTISFPGETDSIIVDTGTYSPSILFQDMLGGDGFEMNDLVTQNGKSIGHVPRPLVHEFNLLHSGIGIIVLAGNECEDASVENPASVYVHRRTDTKRIFPSLYDMFVGGVCTAGEGLRETALREIQEELGLSRTNALSSSPHFTCTVCTSYNRCVVALYSYQYKEMQDSVKWQEEEVAWGDLVPYPIVVQTAKASIERLRKSQTWPGGKDTISAEDGIEETNTDDVPQWDYVPDGLLVWEAWLEWLQNIKVPEKHVA